MSCTPRDSYLCIRQRTRSVVVRDQVSITLCQDINLQGCWSKRNKIVRKGFASTASVLHVLFSSATSKGIPWNWQSNLRRYIKLNHFDVCFDMQKKTEAQGIVSCRILWSGFTKRLLLYSRWDDCWWLKVNLFSFSADGKDRQEFQASDQWSNWSNQTPGRS